MEISQLVTQTISQISQALQTIHTEIVWIGLGAMFWALTVSKKNGPASIFTRARSKLKRDGTLAYILRCNLCSGLWFSLIAIVLRLVIGPLFSVAIYASGAAGLALVGACLCGIPFPGDADAEAI
jgi:hypothetical protein